MVDTRRNKPSYPAIVLPRNASHTEKAMADAMQKLVGQTGNGLDRALTLRDFAQLQGFDVRKIGSGLSLGFNNGQTYDLPTKPVGVEVLPTFNTVFLRWDEPDTNNTWYSLTEIWRIRVELEEDGTPYVLGPNDSHNLPAFANAVKVISVVGNMATDFVSPGQSFVYWIRHVNQGNVYGPLHDINGSLATTHRAPIDVLQEYSDEIYQGENYEWLRSELDSLDAINRAYQAAGIGEDDKIRQVLQGNLNATDFLAEQSLMASLDEFTKVQAYQAQFNKSYARLSGGIHAAVGADEAFVNRLQVLEARWVNELGEAINAQITEYDNALVSPTGAIATQIKAQRVTFGGFEATFQSVINSIANANEATANRASALEAKFNADGDVNQRISSSINQYDEVLVGENGAIAQQISEQRVSYKGQEVTLQTLAATTAGVDNKYFAQWGVKTRVGDLQGGVGFYNDGEQTSFLIDAQVFAVTGGNTKILPFVIKDNKVVMATALIDHADIYSLIAANIVAEKIRASIQIESPVINGGKINGVELDVNGNTTISKEGFLETINARMKQLTIVNADDEVIFNSGGLVASAIIGLSNHISTQVGSVVDLTYIKNLLANQVIASRILAENIEGDVFDGKTYTHETNIVSKKRNETLTLFSGAISPIGFDRKLLIGAVYFQIELAPDGDASAGVSLELSYYIGATKIFSSGKFAESETQTNDNTINTFLVNIIIPSRVIHVPFSEETTDFSVELTIEHTGVHYNDPIIKQHSPCVVNIFKDGGSLS